MMDSSLDRLEQYLLSHVSLPKTTFLREAAYERLKEAIQNVEIQAGDPLSESRLSSAMGISRTPVREALQQLVADGLLQVIPGRGVVIASHSVQQVSDALHVRLLLEPEVMRLAADALPVTARELLQQYTATMEQAAADGERSQWAKVDRSWHQILCDECPNKLLGQMVMQARNYMHNQGASTRVSEQYLIDGTKEHRMVVEAILNHEGQQAAQLMYDHLGRLRENIFKR